MRIRYFVLAVCLLSASCAAQRVTVRQLEAIAAEEHASPDKKAAQRLDGVELVERLTESRLARISEQLPGTDSRQKLLILADASQFLALPADEIPARPAPDLDTQAKIVSRATDFVLATVRKMPNFMARRTTSRFRDFNPALNAGDPFVVTPHRFHFSDRDIAAVHYRNGKEEVDSKKEKQSGPASASGVTNLGFFGPLLGVVMADILQSRIGWGHWEDSPSGQLAVFRYAVPRERSKFTVHYCCLLDGDRTQQTSEFRPPYHGEIAIEPDTGNILRVIVEPELQSPQANSAALISRADVLVEYGAVEIGKRTYICPRRSISIATGAVMQVHGEVYMPATGYHQNAPPTPELVPMGQVHAATSATFTGPTIDRRQVTWINDVAFEDYHVFASEMRVVPDGGVFP